MKKLIIYFILTINLNQLFAATSDQYQLYLQNKIQTTLDIRKTQIEKMKCEYIDLTNDLARFDRLMESIKLPKQTYYKNKYIRFSKNRVATNKIAVVRTSQEQKLIRFHKIIKNSEFNSFYKKYVGKDSASIEESLNDELAEAKESYDSTLEDLQLKEDDYNKSLIGLENEKKNAISKSIKDLNEQIRQLEKEQRQCRAHTPHHPLSVRGCQNCSRLNEKILILKSNIDSIKNAEKITEFNDRRSDLVNMKAASSAKRLAEADYDNSRQTIFKHHYDMVINNVRNIILSKIDDNTIFVKRATEEIDRLVFLKITKI